MKIKLDENMPAGLAVVLKGHGHDAATVAEEGLSGKPDDAVFAAVVRERRFFITMDTDFADIRRMPPGHEGILVLRLARQGRKAVFSLFETLLAQYSLESLKGSIAIADESKIRIRFPKER